MRSADGKPNPELWARGHHRLQPLAFRRMPVLWAAGLFSAGVGMARLNQQPVVVWLAALLLLGALLHAAFSTRVQIEWVRLVPLAGLWIAAGFCCLEIQPPTPVQAELRGFADGLNRTVQGRVVRVRNLAPEAAESSGEQYGRPATLSVDLAVGAVEEITQDLDRMMPVAGGVRMNVVEDAALPPLHCGDRIELALQMREPQRYRDPGAWQYGDYLLEQGIAAHATVRASRLAPGVKPSADAGSLRCRLYAAQAWSSGRMIAYVASPANQALPAPMRLSLADAGMLDAMLFGDRAGLNHELRLGFERTGSFHLFVVSGMHVALIAWGLFWLATRTRLPLWAATLATLLLTTAYALLTGFGVPVQRALWMAAIFLFARLLDRERNTLNALGAAVLGVLVWSPRTLFDASFQMTFLAIVAVAGIAVPLGERSFMPYARAARRLGEAWRDIRFEPRLAQFRVMLRMAGEPFGRRLGGVPADFVRAGLWTMELVLVAVVVEAVMALPMAIYFHRAVALALPANLVSVPVVIVLVPAALVTFLCSLISPWLAAFPGALTGMLLHGVSWVIGHLARGGLADLRVPAPVWGIAAAAGWCIGISCWAARRAGRVWGWATLAMLPLMVGLVLWPERAVTSAGMLEVTAIDVGQGDSLLVVAPGGQAMLVDAGGPVGGLGPVRASRASGFDVGEDVVSPYLWSRRMRRLDVVALTHEHSDHMGGMPAVLRNFRPRELWVGVDVASEDYAALLGEAARLGVRVRHLRAGDRVDWDGTEISVLGPAKAYGNPGAPRNDDSLVMRVEFGRASVMLEGDAEKGEEAAMLASGSVLPVTLLKVAHHGSATSSTEALLAAASPRDAVISVGKGNTFGHPRDEVVRRLAEHGAKLYRTDRFGLTTFLLERDGTIRKVSGD